MSDPKPYVGDHGDTRFAEPSGCRCALCEQVVSLKAELQALIDLPEAES